MMPHNAADAGRLASRTSRRSPPATTSRARSRPITSCYCWGLNNNGQLGTGKLTNSSRPVAAVPAASLSRLEAGNLHACGRDELDRVWCWGYGGEGRLFDGSSPAAHRSRRARFSRTPRSSAPAASTRARSIRTARFAAPGFNRRGQLGDGRHGHVRRAAVKVNGHHECGRRSRPGAPHVRVRDGRSRAVLGRERRRRGRRRRVHTDRTTPQVVNGILDPKQLVAGGEHTCALLQDDSVYCWGANENGQLGDGSLVTSAAPRPVGGSSSGAPTKLTAGDRSTCALYASGAQCWGNMFGQTPQPVDNVKSVAAGDNHVCTVEPNNSVLCYGNGQQYQLGQNMQMNATAPGVTRDRRHQCGRVLRARQPVVRGARGRRPRSAGGSTRARASASAATHTSCRRRRP